MTLTIRRSDGLLMASYPGMEYDRLMFAKISFMGWAGHTCAWSEDQYCDREHLLIYPSTFCYNCFQAHSK